MKFWYKIRILSFFFLSMLIIGLGKTLVYAAPIRLKTIVVTAPHEKGNAEEITGSTLKTHKGVDLAKAISDKMVEATMIRKGAYGNEVSIRGFGQSNLRVLIDGGLLEGACGSRKDPSLSHINMLTVDKIEVREGPFDVTKPGALGGSINIVTKRPQKGFHGEILGKGGSYGFWSGGSYFTGGNDKVQALIGHNYSESRQYKDGDNNKLWSFAPSGRPYNASGRDMKAFKKNDVWGKLQLTPAENQTILLSHTYGYAKDIMSPRVGFDTRSEKTDLTNAKYVIRDLGTFSDKLTLSIYRNKIKHQPYDKYRALASNPPFHRHNHVESGVSGGKIENEQSTGLATFTYGIDMYRRNWNGVMYRDDTGAIFDNELIPDVDTYDYGVYVKGDRDFDKWSLRGGIRYDRFKTEAHKDLKQSSEWTSTNKRTNDLPSGYLLAKYHLMNNFHIFAGIGRSVRTPTSVERYLQSPSPYFHGNPNLDPTKNTEFDVGFETTGQRFSLSVKGFYSDLNDYIYQQGKNSKASHQTWTNIDAHIYGIDVKGRFDILSDLSLEAGASYQRGRKGSQPDKNNDKDLAQIPPLKTRLALHYDDYNFFGTIEWIYSNAADHIDADAGEISLPSWNVANFSAGYQYRQHMTFNVGIDNIFDEHYALANSYEWDVVSGSGAKPAIVNEPGRFFYASVLYTF